MQCKGKKKYQDYIAAEMDAIWMRRKFKESFRVYECPTCGYWHIGRPTKYDFFNKKLKGDIKR